MNINNEDPNLFQSTIAKISVAQICQSIGFNGSQSSALEALSNIAIRYLQSLAKSAAKTANSSGRSQCNVFDIVSGLEDLGIVQGFNGATNLKKFGLKSGVLRDVMRFVGSIDEIPFAKPIPRRIFVKRSIFSKGDVQGETFSHIPHWLPSLPDPSTYKNVGIRIKEKKIGFQEEMSDIQVMDVSSVNRNVDKIVGIKSILPGKRPKVKFKFGLDSASVGGNVELGMRNGTCRGGKKFLGVIPLMKKTSRYTKEEDSL
ncbi:hypothetical protein ACHQM5_004195 [Ranunculus cassubicifolius]